MYSLFPESPTLDSSAAKHSATSHGVVQGSSKDTSSFMVKVWFIVKVGDDTC